jgi:hypothetical protein
MQQRLRMGYVRAARIMDELENRGIVGPSKGAEPRDILIDLDSVPSQQLNTLPLRAEPPDTPIDPDGGSALGELPPTSPHFAVCFCQHCNRKIKFDANELGDRSSVSVSCPHCGVETEINGAQARTGEPA